MAEKNKDDVQLRLRKVEGQVRALQAMLEEGKDTAEVLNQLSAARKAFNKVGFMIVWSRLLETTRGTTKGTKEYEKAADEAMKLFMTLC